MAVETLYFYDKSAMPNRTPLMTISSWKTYSYLTVTAKTRPYDVERTEVEIANTTNTQNFRRASHVYIEGVYDRIYRITGIRQGPVLNVPTETTTDADVSGSCILTLELDALATWWLQTGGPVLYGRWERLPVRSIIEPFQVRPTQMARDKVLASLPEIEHNTTLGKRIVFVKVTVNIGGELTHLCAFCSVENTDQYLDRGLSESNNEFYVYPSLKAIMNNLPLILGVSSGDIYDVSVSEDCPVSYTFTAQGGYQGRDLITIGGTAELRNFTVGGNTYHVMFTNMHDLIMDWQEKTVLLQLDDNEVFMGQVQLIGSDNTVVTTIDTRYFSYNSVTSKWELTLIYRLKMDIGSMYAELQLPDNNVLRFTEGRLPWIGSAWADYVATQRNYDRTIAVVEKNKAQTEMTTGIATSLANGLFTSAFSGGAGAGTAVLGAVGNVANWYEGERARENEMAAKEGLMKSTPGTLYSPEYGVTYLNLMYNSEPMRQICLAMPIDVSAAEFTDYIQSHGYPVSDYYTGINKSDMNTAGRGYIRCTELSSSNANGELYRVLKKQLMKGVLFQVI